jgi:hypothetical protein
MIQADQVYLALNATETTETLIGTITVPTNCSRISGAYGLLMQPLATSGESVSGFFRLAASSFSGKFKFPVTPIAGAAAAGVIQQPPQIIPLDLPATPLDVVSCYMTANKVLTGTGEGVIGLFFQ